MSMDDTFRKLRDTARQSEYRTMNPLKTRASEAKGTIQRGSQAGVQALKDFSGVGGGGSGPMSTTESVVKTGQMLGKLRDRGVPGSRILTRLYQRNLPGSRSAGQESLAKTLSPFRRDG